MNYKISGCLYIKSGYYYARIYYYIGNKRKSKNYATGVVVDNSTPRKAKQQEKAAQRILHDLQSSFVVPMGQTTVSKHDQLFVDTAKDWMARQYGSKAPSTIAGYQYAVNDIIRYFTDICPIRTVDMTSAKVEDYLAWERQRRQKDYAGPYKRKAKYEDGSGIENSVLHRAAIVRSILQYAKRDGIVSTNVASKRDSWVDLPRPQQHVFSVLTPEEADEFITLLEGEPTWFRTAVLLALLLGLRRSEVIGIRDVDIDLQTRQLEIRRAVTQQTIDGVHYLKANPHTKNRKAKSFTLSKSLLLCLTTLIKENGKNEKLFGRSYDQTWAGYLFRYADGQLISPNTLTNKFSQFIRKVGCKKLRYHDLRHSCASILHAHGANMKTVQEILGHTQLTTTVMYTHLYGDEKTQALDFMSSRFLGSGRAEDKKSAFESPNTKTDRNSDRNLCET